METKPVFSFCVRSLHPDITEQNIRNSLSSLATISSIDFVNKNTRPTYSKHENCLKWLLFTWQSGTSYFHHLV